MVSASVEPSTEKSPGLVRTSTLSLKSGSVKSGCPSAEAWFWKSAAFAGIWRDVIVGAAEMGRDLMVGLEWFGLTEGNWWSELAWPSVPAWLYLIACEMRFGWL